MAAAQRLEKFWTHKFRQRNCKHDSSLRSNVRKVKTKSCERMNTARREKCMNSLESCTMTCTPKTYLVGHLKVEKGRLLNLTDVTYSISTLTNIFRVLYLEIRFTVPNYKRTVLLWHQNPITN